MKSISQTPDDFPKIGNPARRALAAAGCENLTQLARFREREVLSWHGMGPKALGLLKEALHAQGLAFTDDKESK